MTTFDRIILVAIALFTWEASANSREAHKHAHELACAMDYAPLCVFHEIEK